MPPLGAGLGLQRATPGSKGSRQVGSDLASPLPAETTFFNPDLPTLSILRDAADRGDLIGCWGRTLWQEFRRLTHLSPLSANAPLLLLASPGSHPSPLLFPQVRFGQSNNNCRSGDTRRAGLGLHRVEGGGRAESEWPSWIQGGARNDRGPFQVPSPAWNWLGLFL